MGLRCYSIPSQVYFSRAITTQDRLQSASYMGRWECQGSPAIYKKPTTADIYITHHCFLTHTTVYTYLTKSKHHCNYYSQLFTSTKHILVLECTYHIYYTFNYQSTSLRSTSTYHRSKIIHRLPTDMHVAYLNQRWHTLLG